MGIKGLNYYIKKNTTDVLIKKTFNDYKNKVIVIDASIYIYQFLMSKNYIENLFIMISKFMKYNITPLFIFDGGIPTEKKVLIEERKMRKQKSQMEYENLRVEYEKLINNKNYKDRNIKDIQEIDKIEKMMQHKKKNAIKIKKNHIVTIKNIFDSFGIQYLIAEGEADILCAKIVKDGNAHACLSEDTDLFVYGCPIVLRYFNLFKETFVEYNLDSILKNLKLDFKSFQDICILSGTDYNKSEYSIESLYKMYKNEYNVYSKNNIDNKNKTSFYDWFKKNYGDVNYDKIYDLFNTNSISYKINNKSLIQINELKNALLPHNFIFI